MRVENGGRLDQEGSINHCSEAELDCSRGDESEEFTVDPSQEHDHWLLIVPLHHWLDHSGRLGDQNPVLSFLSPLYFFVLFCLFALFSCLWKYEVLKE